MSNLDAVKKVLMYQNDKSGFVKEPTVKEMADLVVLVLNSVKTIEQAIESKRLDIDKKYSTPVEQSLQKIKSDNVSLLTQVTRDINSLLENGDVILSQTKSELEAQIQQAIANIRNGEDGIVTEAEIQKAAEIALGMLELPDFDALISETITANPAAIRDSLELLSGDERYKVEITDVQGLTDALNRLSQSRTSQSGTIGRNQVYSFIREAIADGTISTGGGSVSDDAYAGSWNGVTDVAPSKNAVYDKIESLVLGGGSGDVVGPASATDNAIARFDTTTGKLIQNSVKLLADDGTENLNYTGANPVLNLNAPSDVAQTYSVNFTGLTTAGAQFRLFRSTNTTGATALVVHPGNNTSNAQHYLRGNGNSAVNIQSGNFAIGATSGAGKLFIDQNTDAETVFADKDVTNANNTTNSFRIDHTSVVNDAATYTKTGAALQINSNVTETSGTITDSAQVLDINQTHADATGNVVDVNNAGVGRALYINQLGVNATNLSTVTVDQTSNLSASNAHSLLIYSNAAHTGTTNSNLVKVHNDNAGAVNSMSQFRNDGSGNAVDVDNNGNGNAINIDHDGNSASPIVALRVDVANAGAGGAVAAAFTGGAVTGPINPYDATSWNGSAKFATEDAIRDVAETKENLTNKATSFSTVNDTLYPTVEAVAEYVAAAVVGLLDYRGTYDASTNLYPATGGSGLAGAVLKGDFYIVSVAGTLGGTAVTAGDLVIALVDTPAQTSSNWDIVSNEVGYAPENVANKVTSISGASTDTQYPSAKLVYDQLALKAALASPTFTGTVSVPATNFTVGASLPFSDSAGTLTLQNVDALDATTESTIEAAIDTLANLTSIQGRTVTLADAGADAFLIWDDSASAYQNASQADAKAIIGAASDTATGVVELAIASEVTTGTDATRAITPDAYAGSEPGKRTVAFFVSGSASGDSALTTGDDKIVVPVDTTINGMNLVAVKAYVSTVSSSGAPLFQVRRSRRSSNTARTIVDMLSTGVSIDASEFESADAASAVSINTSNDDVQTGDMLHIDCDTAGTGAKGAQILLTFQTP